MTTPVPLASLLDVRYSVRTVDHRHVMQISMAFKHSGRRFRAKVDATTETMRDKPSTLARFLTESALWRINRQVKQFNRDTQPIPNH